MVITGNWPLGVLGQEQQGVGEASAGEEHGIELAAVEELVEASEGSDDVLPGAAVFPAVFHELDVGMVSGLFGTEEHGCLAV